MNKEKNTYSHICTVNTQLMQLSIEQSFVFLHQGFKTAIAQPVRNSLRLTANCSFKGEQEQDFC